MAPSRVKTGSSKGSNKRHTKPPSSGSSSKNKAKSRIQKPSSKTTSTSKPTPKSRQKSKPTPKSSTTPSSKQGRNKRRQYTEAELNIPKLNMITPVGVSKPKGKKKGKVFVDDQESMRTILAIVNAEKEGQIEGKMKKARQLEEIREARQREMDARSEEKRSKLEETKASLKRGRKQRKSAHEKSADADLDQPNLKANTPKPQKKKVAFR